MDAPTGRAAHDAGWQDAFPDGYLECDTYFKIAREQHNLDRCRTQFGLVEDMEKKWMEMERIVDSFCG